MLIRKVDDDTLKILCAAIRDTPDAHVDLRFCGKLSKSQMKAIFKEINRNPNITHLKISSNQFCEENKSTPFENGSPFADFLRDNQTLSALTLELKDPEIKKNFITYIKLRELFILNHTLQHFSLEITSERLRFDAHELYRAIMASTTICTFSLSTTLHTHTLFLNNTLWGINQLLATNKLKALSLNYVQLTDLTQYSPSHEKDVESFFHVLSTNTSLKTLSLRDFSLAEASSDKDVQTEIKLSEKLFSAIEQSKCHEFEWVSSMYDPKGYDSKVQALQSKLALRPAIEYGQHLQSLKTDPNSRIKKLPNEIVSKIASMFASKNPEDLKEIHKGIYGTTSSPTAASIDTKAASAASPPQPLPKNKKTATPGTIGIFGVELTDFKDKDNRINFIDFPEHFGARDEKLALTEMKEAFQKINMDEQNKLEILHGIKNWIQKTYLYISNKKPNNKEFPFDHQEALTATFKHLAKQTLSKQFIAKYPSADSKNLVSISEFPLLSDEMMAYSQKLPWSSFLREISMFKGTLHYEITQLKNVKGLESNPIFKDLKKLLEDLKNRFPILMNKKRNFTSEGYFSEYSQPPERPQTILEESPAPTPKQNKK